jgi:hypothetical protein
MVTTDSLADATIEVRSSVVTVVDPVLVAVPVAAVALEDEGAAGDSPVTRAAVPPVARTALRTAAASTVPMPRPARPSEPDDPAETGWTEKVAAGSEGDDVGRGHAAAEVARGAGGGANRGRSVSGSGLAGWNGSVIRDALLGRWRSD